MMRDRTIPRLVGYDPQRLLPAPDIYRTMVDYMKLSDFYADIFKPSDFRLDEMIEFPPYGSPTGRSIDFTRLYPHQERVEHKVAVIRVTDFSELEARVLATLADKRVRGIVLDLDSAGGEVFGPYDIYERPVVPEKKPMKQNGRSASYLDHDPTKKHKRRKRR